MKQSKIIGIVIVISLSLLGLLLAQSFWIKQSIESAEQEFEQNVHRSLIGLNADLEQFEIAHFLSDYPDSSGNIVFMKKQLNDLHTKTREIHRHLKNDPSGSGNDSVKVEVRADRKQWAWSSDKANSDSIKGHFVYEESVIISDDPNSTVKTETIIVESGNEQDIHVETIFTDETEDVEMAVRKKQLQLQDGKTIETDTAQIFIQDSNAFRIAFNDKSKKVEQVALKLMLVEQQKDFRERLELDSLEKRISKQLIKHGINIPFEFMVQNQENRTIEKITARADSAQLIHSQFNTPLLTSGFSPVQAKLFIRFPSKFQFLMERIWLVVTLSLLFIALISITFFYTIRSMIRQRKIADLKNDFVSNMTHELKTPITSINLACETINDSSFQFEEHAVKNYLTIISQENARLELLVNNVLESSFFDSDRMKLDKTDFSFREIVEKEISRFALIVEKHQGTLNMETHGTDFTINGDVFHLSNVIHNLIDNAIKYSPEKVAISIVLKNDPEGNTLFTIADQGKGIPKKEQEKIFEKFHRIQKGNVHDVKGYGLGLYYTKRILDLHNAELTVQSTEGKGSTFSIKLIKPNPKRHSG